MGGFLRNKFLLWIPKFPGWLPGSRRHPDSYGLYDFSSHSFEVVSMSIGNIVASLLIYAAVTSLYFTAGSVSGVIGVIVIGVTVTICSILFHNQQLVSMVGT